MTPIFTVLMTTCNRAYSLEQTLESLCGVDATDIEWRLIVVDNASRDETAKVLQRFDADARLPLRRLHEPQSGKSRALNLALSDIEDGIVVFIDDDVRVSHGWLQAYARAVMRWPDAHMFGGRIVPVFPPEAPGWVQDNRYVNQSPMFASYGPRPDEGLTIDQPLGPNMAIRREVIGTRRFDVRFGPGGDYDAMGCETEFEDRLARGGYGRMVYVPDAYAEHRVRPEQLAKTAVWARARKWGRSMSLSDDCPDRRRVLGGVPLRRWLAAGRSLLRFAPFYFGPMHPHLKYGWQWQVRSGRVRGYRELRRLRR